MQGLISIIILISFFVASKPAVTYASSSVPVGESSQFQPEIPFEGGGTTQTKSKPDKAGGEESWISTLSLPGRSFYVSTTGSNTNNCSEANPCRTIQHGVNQLAAGDTLYILEGTYEESTDMKVSGLSDAYITIEGIGNVVIDGTNLADYESAFDTRGYDYLRFNNLTLNNFRTGIDIRAKSSYVEIDGLWADGNDYAVRIIDGEHITVTHAYATNSYYGFRANGVSRYLLFDQIEAHNSRDLSINDEYWNGDGVILESDVSDVIIQNSRFSNNADAGIDTKGTGVLIKNVEAWDNKNNFKTWGLTTIENSLSHRARRQPDNGVEGNGITVVDGLAQVSHSTFADNEDKGIAVYAGAALYLSRSIVARRTDDPNSLLLRNSGSFTSDRVLWYSQYEDFSNLKLALTDFRANPNFVDWSAANYRLKNTSLAIDFAPPAETGELDLDFNPRTVGPRSDLGAYEFQTVNAPSFDGIASGDIVKGKIYVTPDRDTYPIMKTVTYYIDGRKINSTSKNPFYLYSSSGYDTKKLKDGTHILKSVFQIKSGVTKVWSIAFTVANQAVLTSGGGNWYLLYEGNSKKKKKK